MNVLEHPGPKGQIILASRIEPVWFSSARDTFSFTMLPEEPKDIRAIYVSDMAKAPSWEQPGANNWVDAKQALFVVGSRIKGGMGADEAVPFSDRSGRGQVRRGERRTSRDVRRGAARLRSRRRARRRRARSRSPRPLASAGNGPPTPARPATRIEECDMSHSVTRRRAIGITAAAAGLTLVPLGRAARAEASLVTWRGHAMGALASLQIHHTDRRAAERLVQRAVSEVRRLERTLQPLP